MDQYSDFGDFLRRYRMMNPQMPPQQPEQPPQYQQSSDTYRQAVGQMPSLSDYHPSMKRRVFSSIAGGLAGLSGNPQVAGAVHNAVEYGPFDRKMEEYRGHVAPLGEVAKLDAENTKFKSVLGHEAAQTEAEKARAEAEKAAQTRDVAATAHYQNMDKRPVKWEPTTEEEATRYGRAMREKPKKLQGEHVVTLKDGSQIVGASKDEEGGYYKFNGEQIDPSQIESAVPHVSQPKNSTAYDTWYNTFQTEKGRTPTSKEVSDTWGPGVAANNPALVANREASTEHTQQETGIKAQKRSPEAIKSRVISMLENPQLFHQMDPEMQDLVGTEWQRVTGMSIPAKLEGPDIASLAGARKSINHVAVIRNIIKDHDVLNNLGPVIGRAINGETTLGDMPILHASPGKASQTKQKLAELQGRLVQLLAQEAQTAVGGRPSHQFLDLMKKASASVTKAPDLFQGALDAVQGGAELTQESAEQGMLGGHSMKVTNAEGVRVPRFKKDKAGNWWATDEGATAPRRLY